MSNCPPPLQCPHGEIPIGQRTLVMGIINMTPDSFGGDGLSGSAQAALGQAEEFVAGGADIIDIGGESTRPGSAAATVQEELDRVLPALEAIRAAVDVPISIDTNKAEVAREALDAGADIINDVYALRREAMLELAAASGMPVILMHMQGTPGDMQQKPSYEDVVGEICDFLAERIATAVDAGVPEEQIIIDPGFGFGKTVSHNLEIVRRLGEFRRLGRPILVGPSRKSTIGAVLNRPVHQRLWGTAATCAAAIINGADIIRVHDVAHMSEVARMTDAIVRGWNDDAGS